MFSNKIIFLFFALFAWWQQDTIFERIQMYNGPYEDRFKQWSENIYSYVPYSPAKDIIEKRDETFNQLFYKKIEHLEIIENDIRPYFNRIDILALNTKVIKNKIIEEPIKIKKEHISILVAGDSMAGDVSLATKKLVKENKRIKIIDGFKHSTGLAVPSYYNWNIELKKMIDTHSPDYIVFMVGANDGQSLKIDQKWAKTLTEAWNLEYASRIKSITEIIPKSSTLIWLEVPPMRKEPLHSNIKNINVLLEEQLKKCKNCNVLKIKHYFGGDSYDNPELRANDGIHYNKKGASIIANDIVKYINE